MNTGVFTNGQTLVTGRVAVSTNVPVRFFVGNKTSNAVLVGESGGISTNLGFLGLSTNASTLYITNGIIKAVSTP